MTNNHGEQECRDLQRHNNGNERTNFAQRSGYPAASGIRERPPAISFNAVEIPNTEIPTNAEDLWPFPLVNEPVASFDSSGLFGAFRASAARGLGGRLS